MAVRSGSGSEWHLLAQRAHVQHSKHTNSHTTTNTQTLNITRTATTTADCVHNACVQQLTTTSLAAAAAAGAIAGAGAGAAGRPAISAIFLSRSANARRLCMTAHARVVVIATRSACVRGAQLTGAAQLQGPLQRLPPPRHRPHGA
jgi:hypothetical protein